MMTEQERADAIQSHEWPDWALQRRASGERIGVARQDPVTMEVVYCVRCRSTAADVLDMALPCPSSFAPRGTAPPVFP